MFEPHDNVRVYIHIILSRKRLGKLFVYNDSFTYRPVVWQRWVQCEVWVPLSSLPDEQYNVGFYRRTSPIPPQRPPHTGTYSDPAM